MAGRLPAIQHTRRQIARLGICAVLASVTTASVARAQDAAGEYTFIVAGVDYREGFDEHNNDILMVSRVNTTAGTVRTVSIPRDLYLEIPDVGHDKVTRAFHHGYYNNAESWEAGTQLLTDTITMNFGLNIDGVAITTFAGFEQIIDALGGLEVVNPYEVEGFGEYPSFPEGQQTLTGEAALTFVRTRSQDGDEGRVMRQHIVLAAILAELQKPEVVTEIPSLVDALRGTVHTNIPMGVQIRLLAMLPTIESDDVAFTLITEYLWGGTLDNGMWVYQADWNVVPAIVQDFLAGP